MDRQALRKMTFAAAHQVATSIKRALSKDNRLEDQPDTAPAAE